VAGVAPGNYTRSKDNRRYAREAIELLRKKPSLAEKPDQLWKRITRAEQKAENSQMDVAISLWQAGAIREDDV
jgi:hypothetical protein